MSSIYSHIDPVGADFFRRYCLKTNMDNGLMLQKNIRTQVSHESQGVSYPRRYAC